MTDEEMIALLLESAPELQPLWAAEKDSYLGLGAHVIYGDFLVEKLLVPVLSTPPSDPALLGRVFDFLEKLSASGDPYVCGVVQCTVLERLGDSREWLEEARRHMGPATLALSHEIERRWGRE